MFSTIHARYFIHHIDQRPSGKTTSSKRGVNCCIGSEGYWFSRVMDVALAGSVNIRECSYTCRRLMDTNLRQKTFSLVNVVVVHADLLALEGG